MSSKEHYKLFKAGKLWCSALIVGTLVGFGALKANADAVTTNPASNQPTTTQVAQSNNQSVNNNSNVVTLAKPTTAKATTTTSNTTNNIATPTSTVANENNNDKQSVNNVNNSNSEQAVNTASTNSNQNTTTDAKDTLLQPAAGSANFSKNGVVNENGSTYYYHNGQRQTNYLYKNGQGQVFYFGNDGKEAKNYFYHNWGNTYYFGNDGVRFTNQWYRNWGHSYYFDGNGVRVSGTGYDGPHLAYRTIGNGFYAFNKDGVMYTGLLKSWGRVYNFGNDGKRYTNQFYKRWGNIYYFGNDGARYTNQFLNKWGHNYYYDNYGVLVKNRTFTVGNTTYVADKDGILSSQSAANTANTANTNASVAQPAASVSGWVAYLPKGSYGVDVSSYQGTNLTNYARNGAKFAIVKLTESTGYLNPNGFGQIASAKANNMMVMAYHFARFGGSVAQANNEARFFISEAQRGLPKGSILVLDNEANFSGLQSANTQATLAFMQDVRNAGYVPMIYTSSAMGKSDININTIENTFPNSYWVAAYPNGYGASSSANFGYFPSNPGVAMWQFTPNWKGLGVDASVLTLPLVTQLH